MESNTARPKCGFTRYIGYLCVVLATLVFCFSAVKGASLNDVRAAQRMLFQLGYDPGSIDGKLGSNTRSALERFQADLGLEVSGVLDDGTITALTEAISQLEISPESSIKDQDRIEIQPLDPPPIDANDGSGVPSDSIDTGHQSTGKVTSQPVPSVKTTAEATKVSSSDVPIGVLFALILGALAFFYSLRGNASQSTPSQYPDPNHQEQATAGGVRFEDVSEAPNSYRPVPESLKDLRDALTTTSIDPNRTIYRCYICGVYYHEESVKTLVSEFEGLCVSCQSSDIRRQL
jgi:hypothetical protein